MNKEKTISGFSKLSKRGKIKWIVENFFRDPEAVMHELVSFWHGSDEQQKILDGFSENTISNFHLPYGVAPNFVINGKTYCVPMVIEESSVVAAAASAAKFWMIRGGFKAKVLSTRKIGQVHFCWKGNSEKLYKVLPELKKHLKKDAAHLTENMIQRGGGVEEIILEDLTDREDHLYQLKVVFETCDSMGANFINSVLESFAQTMITFFESQEQFNDEEKDVEVLMSILSNYTPECLVRAEVQCPVEDLGDFQGGMDSGTFARRFCKAVKVAKVDSYRATTHNKGIFNGIDAVVIATANDFRAVEACGHSYAARSGKYQGLSNCEISDGLFRFWLEVPLCIGTVGGLTSLHPIARRSLELLENPSAVELMQVIASTGLAQNFAAIKSLVTTGIQKGHMKMHLYNILNHVSASEEEKEKALVHFDDKIVSFKGVRDFVFGLREKKPVT